MRKKTQKQLPLMTATVDHPKAMELEAVSDILDTMPIINELAWQDLTQNVRDFGTGAEGMSAEQVVRAAILKHTEGCSYDELSFHIVDSACYRRLCRIGFAHKGFKKSGLCKNIKGLSAETWEAINRILVAYGQDKKIEKGRQARIDSTVVSSYIHEPTDSTLLWDSVRVLTHIMVKARKQFSGLSFPFTSHTKRAKRRMMGVIGAKNKKIRKGHYRDLLKVTYETLGYAKAAQQLLEHYDCTDLNQTVMAKKMAKQLDHYIQLALQVIDQTERRVIHGEMVPASEKVVSIFEPHTDIIVKDNRDTLYGHKGCLNVGASNLIMDCLILDGNPADATVAKDMFSRHNDIYGRYPLKVALDGGFASRDNLKNLTASKTFALPRSAAWTYRTCAVVSGSIKGCADSEPVLSQPSPG